MHSRDTLNEIAKSAKHLIPYNLLTLNEFKWKMQFQIFYSARLCYSVALIYRLTHVFLDVFHMDYGIRKDCCHIWRTIVELSGRFGISFLLLPFQFEFVCIWIMSIEILWKNLLMSSKKSTKCFAWFYLILYQSYRRNAQEFYKNNKDGS